MTETTELSNIPDGPTELPADTVVTPETPPPVVVAERKEKVEPEPAYKYDPRNEIYARRSRVLAGDQKESDTLFKEGREAGNGLPTESNEPVTPVATADEFVTIKVYGEERQAPKVEVEQAGGIAAYQKAVAADVKLQRAAEREAALKTEEQRLLQIANNLRSGLDENGQPLAPKPPSQGVPASIGKEALKATVKGLYSGDSEEAEAALGALVEQISRQGPSTEVSPEIVRAVEAQVLERMESREEQRKAESDVEAANRIFRDSFSDIANDPEMMLWAKGMANALSEDPNFEGKSRAEIAQEVGSRIRKKLGKPTSELDTRRQLKEKLPQTPSGSGRMPQAEPQRFPTNADYIQQLRRNSGSNSAPR